MKKHYLLQLPPGPAEIENRYNDFMYTGKIAKLQRKQRMRIEQVQPIFEITRYEIA